MKLTIQNIAKYAANELAKGHPRSQVLERVAAALIETNQSANIKNFENALTTELKKTGYETVEITSAVKLGEVLKKKLADAVGSPGASINEIIDESIFGGVKVQNSEQLLDMTIRRKLQLFKTEAGR